MRVQKLSLAAVALAAGLSLTACQGGDDTSASANDSSSAASSPSSSAQQGSGGSSASDDNSSTAKKSGTSATSGTRAAAGSGTCKTSQLGMSVSGGMGEGDRLVNLKNTGSTTCTLKGFPGVDLKGKDGSLNAQRSNLKAPTVSVKPGAETRFTLHTPRNDTGGSGVDITSLVVTPPNETHSKTLPTRINLPASDSTTSDIHVDPVGTGK